MIVCIAGDLFGFKKRSQFLIRANDEAFAIVAVSINNENPAPLGSNERDASPAPA